MPLLKFTLSEEGVGVLRDALACLNKFSDEVSLEAKKDQLMLTTFNISKTAYASCSFANRFFSKYHYAGSGHTRDKFFCNLHIRALLSVFRSRGGDPSNEREDTTTIERCDIVVIDESGKKSRLIAKIVFRNGITTKYRLPFEVAPPEHARFDDKQAVNNWAISSRTLRQLMDHFGPGIEYLDLHADENVVNFTCFTEKAANGDEVLKKPLHTSIAVERDEFDSFFVEEDKLHIVIGVKDFRAIIQHAFILRSDVKAKYSTPAKPMQFRYDGDAIKCEFLLMTIGERGAPGQKAKRARANAKAPRGPGLEASTSRATSRAGSHAPTLVAPPQAVAPPPKTRPNPIPSLRPGVERSFHRPPPATLEEEALFVPQDQDNDEQWNPVTLDEDDEEDQNARLGWDASGNPNPSANIHTMMGNQVGRQSFAKSESDDTTFTQLDPTQPLSEARKFGLFDR
ncbi:Rad9-domain-containing protein [Xylariaceae sp. FL0255]|nr:Rad9-domain-containing protein [Xylariaceae sp. FL0255]